MNYSPLGFKMLPTVIKNLLIINFLLFFITMVMGMKFNIDLTRILGLHFFQSEYFYPHQIISHMFMHGGIGHIFFNMFALWMFGNVLENIWGPRRFMIYYFATGLGAAFLHTMVNWIEISSIKSAIDVYYENQNPEAFMKLVSSKFPEYKTLIYNFVVEWQRNPLELSYFAEVDAFLDKQLLAKINIPTVGASGAVFGLLLAFGMTFPNANIYIYFLFPIKAKYFVILYGAIELYSGVFSQPGNNIAHFAHLGGMIFGFFLIRAWRKRNNY